MKKIMNQEKNKIQITTRYPKINALFIVHNFDQIKHRLRFTVQTNQFFPTVKNGLKLKLVYVFCKKYFVNLEIL